ncbi:apolipoprotein A-IV-like [Rhineura floridana]|uniref:apolipoprotein A-IV-like n=1 Tax=Rhineura floridana TaxID=261503 RepID=UPI002AC818E6|nr:apolipoprotein A-IV-like [Rhineura floridana]
MKLLVVFLSLAIVTGSQASFLSDEPARPRLEQIHDTIRDYLAKISKTTTENIDSIRNSELGKEINTRITESIDSAKSYQAELQKHLPLAAQDAVQKLIEQLQELDQTVQPFTDNLNQKVQGSVTKIHKHLAPYAEELLEQAEQHTVTLRQTLASGTEDLTQKLHQNVEELRTQLGPLAEDLKAKIQQHIQDFRQGVEPLAQQLQGSLSEGVQQVHKNLHPYAEDLQQKLVPLAEDFRGRLSNIWTSLLERVQ